MFEPHPYWVAKRRQLILGLSAHSKIGRSTDNVASPWQL